MGNLCKTSHFGDKSSLTKDTQCCPQLHSPASQHLLGNLKKQDHKFDSSPNFMVRSCLEPMKWNHLYQPNSYTKMVFMQGYLTQTEYVLTLVPTFIVLFQIQTYSTSKLRYGNKRQRSKQPVLGKDILKRHYVHHLFC